jgi:hypothetical protein
MKVLVERSSPAEAVGCMIADGTAPGVAVANLWREDIAGRPDCTVRRSRDTVDRSEDIADRSTVAGSKNRAAVVAEMVAVASEVCLLR